MFLAKLAGHASLGDNFISPTDIFVNTEQALNEIAAIVTRKILIRVPECFFITGKTLLSTIAETCIFLISPDRTEFDYMNVLFFLTVYPSRK
ncbi:hypothetical protein A7981_04350 [Methylovorus sp. MM2]|nr:hypothetical protein A7981_04350 [Methylovorus sp. MM2]